MPRRRTLSVLFLSTCWLGGTVAGARPRTDTRLVLAEKFVAGSQRYMHQSRLRRGMSGYGLTVMTGTKVEKFQVTILSVMRNRHPHHDVILCRLSGLGLEKTGIIAGMSGSPVFIRDPADGKYKMVGAVAYGWSFQKEPIAGVQPIAQMLAIEGVPLPGAKQAPPAPSASARGASDADLLRALLSPKKMDFVALGLPGRLRRGFESSSDPRMVPLVTPVMAAGAGPRTIALAERLLKGTGLVPLAAGAVTAAQARAAGNASLHPGAAVSIPLVSGDSDWAAVGTVTEVLGKHVLVFGHSLNAEGPVELPMGPAYVHGVIPTLHSSFKLGSTLKVTGAATHDEYTAVGGLVGRKAEMIPVNVTVAWPGVRQRFRYRVVRHKWLTAVMGRLMLSESAYANRDLPERHTLDYAVEIDFGELGKYRVHNRASFSGVGPAASDLSRPLVAMMNNDLGEPVFPRSIDVRMRVLPVQKTAEILWVRLERNTYRPGQRLRGNVGLRPFRSRRIMRDFALDLPEDLPDGRYHLTVTNAEDATAALEEEMPHRFKPRTVKQLFQAVQRMVELKTDSMYVRVPLPAGGLAVRKQELECLPPSLAGILARAAPVDSQPYRRALVKEVPTGYVLSGSAETVFTVEKEPARQN